MAERKTPEERSTKWWADWREVDFSWDGLAKQYWTGWSIVDGAPVETDKAPPGAPSATLQDYWRGEEAKLVEGDGKRWARPHVPERWLDGSPAKSAWSFDQRRELRNLIAKKVEEASACDFDAGLLIGADRRAQLQGCVLFSAPIHREGRAFPLSLNCDNASFLDDVRFRSTVFSADVTFQDARFAGFTSFFNAKFEGAGWFENALFAASCTFQEAAFEGSAGFRNVVFLEESGFGSAKFVKDVSFSGCEFEGADFFRTEFGQDSYFNSTHYYRDVRFEGAVWKDRLWFSESVFEKKADFKFGRNDGNAWFDSVEFKGEADFSRRRFVGVAGFHSATFVSDMTFAGCVFVGAGEFERMTVPADVKHFGGAFRGARFESVGEFTEAKSFWVAAFDGAVIEKKLIFDDGLSDQASDKEFKKVIMRGVRRAIAADLKQRIEGEQKGRAAATQRPKSITGSERKKWKREFRDARLRELEGGCRAIKLAMGRDRNEALEQRYYRFQLLTRRERDDTLPGEKFFSLLYDLSADYGASMVRPFAMLAALMVLFSVGYVLIGLSLDRTTPNPWVGDVVSDAWSAFSFSWVNTFRPLSALSADNVRPDDHTWLSAMLYQFGPGVGFGVRALATVQSLLAIVLAFLFALAVRRRFQIS